jgi:SAM-dependent methyltransferase
MSALPVNDIIEWDIPNWSQLINLWTPVLEKLPRNSKVLAIGERNGGLSAWLALQGFTVVCTDREFPTEKAKELHSQLGIADRIIYDKLDIVNCNWKSEEFDIIVAKSVIGGLKADPGNRLTRNFQVQQMAVQNIHKLLKGGGYFFSAENMQGSWLLKQFKKWKKKDKGWRYLKWQEIKDLYSDFKFAQLEAFGVLPTAFGNKTLNKGCFLVNKRVLRYLPYSYKYISFVVVQKQQEY